VKVAVEKCAEDTMGQTCYICLEAAHPHTGEGLVRGCACGDRDGVSSPELGVVHVSCLAEQAKILVAEAMEDNLSAKAVNARWLRWSNCSLCEQNYHGVVAGALGWACWKTYVGRPEVDGARDLAMEVLGNGLYAVGQHEDSLTVRLTKLAAMRRVGASEENILAMQGNLASTYAALGRSEDAIRIERDVYSGRMKVYGEEHGDTLEIASNYATSLLDLKHFEDVKALLRKMIPVARHVLGKGDLLTLKMGWLYAMALYKNYGATVDDLHEAVETLESVAKSYKRVFGQAHPKRSTVQGALAAARAVLAAQMLLGSASS